jgi:hypothetical protein
MRVHLLIRTELAAHVPIGRGGDPRRSPQSCCGNHGRPAWPPERLKVLRASFDAAMKDPEVVEDAKRQHLVINPVNGADVEKLLVQFANYPPNIIARARAAIGQ